MKKHYRSVLVVAILALLGCGRRDVSVDKSPTLSQSENLQTISSTKPHYYNRVVAICIGIEKYRSVGIGDAEASERDTKAIASVFREKFGYEVVELIRSQATKSGILSQIDKTRAEIGEHDALIVYFAGHGQVFDLPSFGRTGYLLPYDADLDLRDTSRRSQWDEQAIDMRDLAKSVESCRAQHVLFILDSCFSGFMARRGMSPSLSEMMSRRSRCVIAATTDKQSSSRNSHTGMGHFTGAILNRLKVDEPKSLTDVFNAVRDDVVRSSNRLMFPQRGDIGEDDGEFVFIPLAFPAQQLNKSIEYLRDQALQRASRRATVEEYYNVIDASDYRNGPRPVDFEKIWEPRFERFRSNANNGDVLALSALSLCYAKGIGTEKNPNEAYRCARLAFDSGRDEGLYPLWYCLETGVGTRVDSETARRLVTQQIKDLKQASPFQRFILDNTLLNAFVSRGERDAPRAFRTLRDNMQKSIDGGVKLAALRLITCYIHFKQPINENDREKLLPIVSGLAKSGNPVAQYLLYFLMATQSKGLTEEECQEAFKLVLSSAEQGYAPAQVALASEQYSRKPFSGYLRREKNPWRASMWASRAASQGNADGHKILAMLYLYQDVPLGNQDKAIAYFRKAVELDPNDTGWSEHMALEFLKAGY